MPGAGSAICNPDSASSQFKTSSDPETAFESASVTKKEKNVRGIEDQKNNNLSKANYHFYLLVLLLILLRMFFLNYHASTIEALFHDMCTTPQKVFGEDLDLFLQRFRWSGCSVVLALEENEHMGALK